MKNKNEIQDILLKMHYDTKKTLTENSDVINKSKFLQEQSETIVSSDSDNLTMYEGLSGPVWFNQLDLEGVTSITKRNNWTDLYPSWTERKDCQASIDWNKKPKQQQEQLFGNFFNPHEGKLLSFTVSGVKYYATPLLNCTNGKMYFGGYRKSPLFKEDAYVPPKLPPQLNTQIKETSNKIVKIANDDVMSSPEKFAEFLYELRDIVSSVTFQIFSAALSIAIASVAGPVAFFFSRLLDWGIDVIVLLADLIAAMMYPENTLHFEHLGQDVLNLGLSFGIMGLFKLGSKTLKGAVELLTPEMKQSIKQFREWISNQLNKIASMVEGTSIGNFIKTFKEWVENLFDKNFGKIFSTFVLVGLPVSTMIYLSMLLADPLFKKMEGPLSTVVGIPLVWLRNWKLGDEIPAEYAKKLEKINPKMQEGQAEELEKIEQSTEPTEQDLVDKNSEKMRSISKTLQESNKKLAENNNQEYCNRLISHLSEPCKGYLEKKLTENKVSYPIEGENSGLLMVDNVGYIIEWVPGPPRLLDASEKELTCVDDTTLPSPTSKG